jgi:hypothetical protein
LTGSTVIATVPTPWTITDYITTTTSTITVKFSGAETKTTGDLLLSVYALNGAGNSAARTLKLARALPTAPTKLELKDGATLVSKVGAYTAKETPLTLTATPFTTQGAESTSFNWVLPAGVNVTAGHTNLTTPETDINGNKTWTSTGAVLTINLAGISGTSPSMTSIPLNVYAVNGAGTSATARTLTLSAAAPATPGTITLLGGGVPKFNPTCPTSTVIQVEVPFVLGVSYNWTVAGNKDRVYCGDGTNSICINVEGVTTPKLLISVVASNGTGSSIAKTLDISKITTCGNRIAPEALTTTEKFSAVAYPNPATEGFRVKSSNGKSFGVQVYDMLGRSIEQRQMSSDAQIGSNYAKGVYNVIVNQGANTKSVRVIKR